MQPRLTSLLDSSISITIGQAKQIRCQIVTNALAHLEPLLIDQILKSTRRCSPRTTHFVRSILRHAHKPGAASTSCAIRYLCQGGEFRDALSLYAEMHCSRLLPNTYAVSSALKACARIPCEFAGLTIHGQVVKLGFRKVVFVQTAIVDFYSKTGDMVEARKVFDEIRGKNVVTWNSMLAGYVRCGDLEMAQGVFDEMPERDVISWNSMVSVYARAKDMNQAYVLFHQMPQKSSASWNAMVMGYIECGNLVLARSFFDSMPERNGVSYVTMISGYSKQGNVESARNLFDEKPGRDLLLYNAMIACYAQNNLAKEALELFDEMLNLNVDNLQPDKMTFSCVISATAQLGDSKYGAFIESYMCEMGITLDDHLLTALIDLYAKCGDIDKAMELFDRLSRKDLISYTAMILGCGINGRAKEAIRLFEEMLRANISPNLATFTGVLSAYNHVGMVEEGYRCFSSMKSRGLDPTRDHYAIVVDLLGRAGRLQEAHELIEEMPVRPHAGVWGALLLACSMHNNIELAELAAKNCVELEPDDSSGYLSLLANIYASNSRWDEANELRKAVGEKGLVKITGSSWIERQDLERRRNSSHFSEEVGVA